MKQDTPTFSIIIPAYNYAHSIERAITSVLNQDGNDWTLLVIDDGSSDNTGKVVREIQKNQGMDFRFIQRPNSGPAATRNTGIDKSTGRYLIFLDADDEMLPRALQYYRQQLADGVSIGMLVGGHLAKNACGREKAISVGVIATEPKQRLKNYLLDKSMALSNGAVAISRDVFDKYRYPEKFRTSEDISMFAFILANYSVASIDLPLAVIHKHADSLRHNADYAVASGLLVVDEVFDPQRIPKKCQTLKSVFMAQRCLSLFRTLFLASQYNEARTFYHKAVRIKPLTLFRMPYLVKYIKSYFKL